MQYLYFSENGRLHIKAKVLDPELELQFPNPIAVHTNYDSMVDGGVAEEEGMPTPRREKTRIEVEADITYSERRAAAYPSYADQFDKIFHEGVDAWKSEIQAIKDANPKVTALEGA
jgi:hypothetical protein